MPPSTPIQDHACDLFVKSGIKGTFNRVPINDIMYVENAGNYVYIHLNLEKIIAYLTLAELLAGLPTGRFSRIHQSFIVNHAAITSLEYGQVRLVEELTLPIGGTYRAAFREKMDAQILTSKRE